MASVSKNTSVERHGVTFVIAAFTVVRALGLIVKVVAIKKEPTQELVKIHVEDEMWTELKSTRIRQVRVEDEM